MVITYTNIHQWADTRDAQAQLPVLVRRLIRTTIPEISEMSFPGGDAVHLPGVDGFARVSEGSEWVPKGRSVWEMGCNKDINSKANEDYNKRTVGDAALTEDERHQTTFMFVTPRSWTGKDTWLKEKRREKNWKDVRAFDASDLDQWLEASNATSYWLAELLGMNVAGIETPKAYLQRWANASVPHIADKLLLTGRERQVDQLLSALRNNTKRSISILADDKGEALAFVSAACLQRKAWDLLDRMIFMSNPREIKRAVGVEKPIIVVNSLVPTATETPDLNCCSLLRPYSRGQLTESADIELPFIHREGFVAGLKEMGIADAEANLVAKDAGFSLPVLRRNLADDQEIKAPTWARYNHIKRNVLPFALAGSWRDVKDEDWAVLECLSDKKKTELEQDIAYIQALDGAPLIGIDRTYNCVSQLDTLFALGSAITNNQIDRLFDMAKMVFGERDPTLDLPERDWWMATIHDKENPFSDALTQGLSNTVCILAIYGEVLCGSRLGVDFEVACRDMVRSSLTNLSSEQWLSIRNKLRFLAEISPEAFLECLEIELEKPEPTIKSIMRVTDSGLSHGDCLRTDLLWALETLAWNTDYLHRVCSILLRLCEYKTEDNYANTPKRTLSSLFRSWLPMTNADLETRNNMLAELISDKRTPAFELLLSMIPDGIGRHAGGNAKPRWRKFPTEIQTLTEKDVYEAEEAARQTILTTAPFTMEELVLLLSKLKGFKFEDQKNIISEISSWANKAQNSQEIATLRESVHKELIWLLRQNNETRQPTFDILRPVYDLLEPDDLTDKHRWLFDQGGTLWPDIDSPYQQNICLELIEERRNAAIQEIFQYEGVEGVFNFAMEMATPQVTAVAYMHEAKGNADIISLATLASQHADLKMAKQFLRGLFEGIDMTRLEKTLASVFAKTSDNKDLTEFVIDSTPFIPQVWSAVEKLGNDAAIRYWKNVHFRNYPLTEDQMGQAVDKLLSVKRPSTAFDAAHFDPPKLSGQRWVRILNGILNEDEPTAWCPDAWMIEDVFLILDRDDTITDEKIAHLEISFVQALSYGTRKTKALDRILSKEPAFFVWILALRYKRQDDGDDPEEWKISDVKRAVDLASAAYAIMASWRSFPGLNDDGTFDCDTFKSWNNDVRKLATNVSRGPIADISLGEAYAYSPSDIDGNWPSLPVCDLLNECDGNDLRKGFITGVRNSRGTVIKSHLEGGQQERDLAEKYSAISDRLHNSHPRLESSFRDISQSYIDEADREDQRTELRDRWNL